MRTHVRLKLSVTWGGCHCAGVRAASRARMSVSRSATAARCASVVAVRWARSAADRSASILPVERGRPQLLMCTTGLFLLLRPSGRRALCAGRKGFAGHALVAGGFGSPRRNTVIRSFSATALRDFLILRFSLMDRPGVLAADCRGDLSDMALPTDLLTYCAGAGGLGCLSSPWRPGPGACGPTPITAPERYIANGPRPLFRSSKPMLMTVMKTTRPRKSITAAYPRHRCGLRGRRRSDRPTCRCRAPSRERRSPTAVDFPALQCHFHRPLALPTTSAAIGRDRN